MRVFRVETFDDSDYDEIVALLRDGGIIAFPTDTAYGLGVDPFNEAAVEGLFRLKGRSETKPILLIVDSVAMAESVCQPTTMFHALAEQFWPGPLTLVVPCQPHLPDRITAGTRTIGLRWPAAPLAGKLVNRFRKPITATSANRTGLPAAINAEEIRSQFDEGLDVLVDGGSLPFRGGSTLLDITVEPPALLREGPICFEALQSFLDGRIDRRVG